MLNFKLWLEGKYLSYGSAWCGHCLNPLVAYRITKNPQHMYSWGQFFECRCGKSKVWTNSARNLRDLGQYLRGECPVYRRGFCNDAFCGYCNKYIYPLKNGEVMPGHERRVDRYGCTKCADNQQILIDGYKKIPEGGEEQLRQWYKRHQDEVDKILEDPEES